MSEPQTDYELIAIVPKNGREDVRVRLSTYRGMRLVDIRVFADADGGATRVPTKKGASLRIETLPALIDALGKAALDASAVPASAT